MPNKEAREQFPKTLKYYMDKYHLSQSDIAERLGVSNATVSMWCNGRKFPRVDKMQELANIFGVLISDMYSEPDDEYERIAKESAVPPDGNDVPKVAVFFRDYMSGKSPEFQEMVLRFLRAADGESFSRAMKDENIKDLEDMIREHT